MFQFFLQFTKIQAWLPSFQGTNAHSQSADSREDTVQISSDSHGKRIMSFHSSVKRSGLCDCTNLSRIQPPLSLLTDKKPVFPTEAVIAAAVVVTLTVLFGIVAQKDKIFKVWKALVS